MYVCVFEVSLEIVNNQQHLNSKYSFFLVLILSLSLNVFIFFFVVLENKNFLGRIHTFCLNFKKNKSF